MSHTSSQRHQAVAGAMNYRATLRLRVRQIGPAAEPHSFVEEHSRSHEDASDGAQAPNLPRFQFAAADLLPMLPNAGHEPDGDPLEPDDASRAIGRSLARLNVEEEFATVYLTFTDGTYLAYASRVDEEGVILLDRFSEPAAEYSNYWIFDELEGETGPPPADLAPVVASGFHPDDWQGSVGRTVYDLGWDEEGMQAFIHFQEGGYLTLAARTHTGSAYLVGYFSAQDPENDEYMEFEPPDKDE